VIPRVLVIVTAVLSVVMLGARHGPPPSEEPASVAQRKLALNAVERLRSELNSGDCESFYDREPWFRSSELCERLHRFGEWQHFDVSIARYETWGALSVRGTSFFAHGTRRMELIWQLQGGELRWYSLSIALGGQLRPWPGPHRRADPPMFRPSAEVRLLT